jgi:hypothetical protein
MIGVGRRCAGFPARYQHEADGIALRARDAQAFVVIRAAPDYVDLIGGSTPDRARRNRITAFASW